AAERLLAQRSQELYDAHRKLSNHATSLSQQVIEAREVNAELQGQTHRAQAAVEAATEKALTAERRLWDSLRSIPDGYAMFDRDQRLVIANSAYLDVFDSISEIAPGASYETLLRVAMEEGIVDPEGLDDADWIDRMLALWEQDPIPETIIRLYNGASIRMVDRRTERGDIVSLAIDITQAVRREAEIREARDAAEAASRAKSSFLANMSHEIRTPMNGVVGMTQVLAETDLTDEQADYVETIRNSGDALLEIINDILDYSKIEADKLVLRPQEFDLEGVILDVFRLLNPVLKEKRLAHELDFDPKLPSQMLGDPGRLRQILMNLMGNAAKFTHEGHVNVVVAQEAIGDDFVDLRISVEDTGIGIPDAMQEAIFGDFTQVEDHRARSYEGTGLGLAITQRLVELMGGNIWVESTEGAGAKFRIRLRLALPEGARTDPLAPLPEPLRSLHVIDNSAQSGAGLWHALEKLGAVKCAPAGAKATVWVVDEMPGDPTDVLADLAAAGFRGPVILASEAIGLRHPDSLPAGLSLHLVALPLRLADLRDRVADVLPEIAPDSAAP
ncbi:MAG: ATP-binding protein, partial [Pseudomonadota bacterium]